jgi:hypothetical protein
MLHYVLQIVVVKNMMFCCTELFLNVTKAYKDENKSLSNIKNCPSLMYYSLSICEYVHAQTGTSISHICKSFGRKVSVHESKYIVT